MPSTTLTAPEPETTTGPQLIDPDLGIPAVATVEADTFQWWTHRRRQVRPASSWGRPRRGTAQAHSDAAGGGAARAMRDAGGGAEVFFPSLDGGGDGQKGQEGPQHGAPRLDGIGGQTQPGQQRLGLCPSPRRGRVL